MVVIPSHRFRITGSTLEKKSGWRMVPPTQYVTGGRRAATNDGTVTGAVKIDIFHVPRLGWVIALDTARWYVKGLADKAW